MQGSLAHIPYFKIVIKITFFLLKLEEQTQHSITPNPWAQGRSKPSLQLQPSAQDFGTAQPHLIHCECGDSSEHWGRGEEIHLGSHRCFPGSPEAFSLFFPVFELFPCSQVPSLSVSAHGGARCHPTLGIPSLPWGTAFSLGRAA